MQTIVTLKRHVTKGKEKNFFTHLNTLRHNAMNQDGYISGETLLNAEDTSKVMVISKWETLAGWQLWMESDKRKELELEMGQYQGAPTDCDYYIFRKFRAAADQGFPSPMQGNKTL